MQNIVLYSPLRHRLIKKGVYGVTIAALVWFLLKMFIILILKNRMFNQSPIFSTSSGPSVFRSHYGHLIVLEGLTKIIVTFSFW